MRRSRHERRIRRLKRRLQQAAILLAGSALLALLIFGGLHLFRRFHLSQTVYSAKDFNIETIYSATDFNGNDTDDYTDFLLGARQDAKNHPTYNGDYQPGGYPPDNIGVCADVVWRAFKNAGYCLRDMVDADIAARPAAYPNVTTRDPNIDFRRVKNLRVFFDTYAISLTTDPTEIDQWQPGDIVIFREDKHIGMVSDKRDADGLTFIIHNSGQPDREEDYLPTDPPTSHYRFDASQVPQDLLIPWHE